MNSPRSPLEEDEEFDDGYDSNLMGDEEDKKKLAQMTEKEREQELFNRSERRETLKIRFEIERKLRNKAKKREHEKSQVRATKRLRASEIYSSDDSSDGSDEFVPDEGNNNISSSSSSPASVSSSSSSSSSASSPESSPSNSEPDDRGEQRADEDVETDDFHMTLEDLRSIQLKRDKIEEWVYAPFFKETVIGLFVKISVGNKPNPVDPKMVEHIYKVAQIIDIIKCPIPYTIFKNKTDKQCLVKVGRVERTYKMSFISNRTFDEEDFRSLERQDMPNRESFTKKKRDLHYAKNYAYTEKDIAHIVSERTRLNDSPYNYALKKTELLGEKADAEASNDYDKAAQIQAIIDELEAKARELEKMRSSSTFSAISFVNERNRYKNIHESERVLKESKSIKTEDPFTRRKCTPTIVHNKNNKGSTQQREDQTNGQQASTLTTIDNTSTGESVKSVDDLFQAHANVELNIDIDII